MVTRQMVRKWMRGACAELADVATGEVSATMLAEAVAIEFDRPEWLDDDGNGDWVWDAAADVANDYNDGLAEED